MFAAVASCLLLAIGFLLVGLDQRRVDWRDAMGYRAEITTPGDGAEEGACSSGVVGMARLARMLRKTSSV